MRSSKIVTILTTISILLPNFNSMVHAEKIHTSEMVPQYQSRDQIPLDFKWRLEDLYHSQEEWKKDITEVESLSEQLNGFVGTLHQSPQQLKQVLDQYVRINRIFEKVFAYAKLSFHTNKNSSQFQQLSSQVDDLSIKVGEQTSFVIPELLAIPKSKLTKFLDEPDLQEYRRWVNVQIRSKDHTLPKEMEEILAKSGAMANTPESIFSMLTKDITFPTIKDESGKEVKLTPANYGTYIQSENREIRKRAFEAYYQTINQFKDTFAQILQSEVKKNIFYADVRNYSSTRQASLETNNIPLSVYDNLISTVHEELPKLHEYMALKEKAVGTHKLHLYDLYLGFEKNKKPSYIPYPQAQKRVKEGLSILGEEYSHLLDKAFNERWIDVYYTPGKRSGAYQWGAYDVHPFILLNYRGGMDDVFTLAHEFGHAAHSYFTNKNQKYLNSGYPIFTAEVASTTNEALLFKEMYNNAKSKQEKIAILNQRLEDYSGTLFLQTLFAEFEKIIHEKSEKGEALTAEAMSKIYGDLLKKYYGPSLQIDKLASLGWARIPHFYRNYYVYQYATGFAAANVFARQMMEEGQPAVDRYIHKFLSAGDSKDPMEVLKDAGVNMNSPKVIKQALKGFEETLDELSKLLAS
ncbi:MAG TPA: oligoendopeptidase F [Bacillota bacterium]|nr:oligoendopeptidase F [Bacillota bacterium]